MARVQNQQEVLERWAARTKAAASTTYRSGIMGVIVSPGEVAASRASQWAEGCQRALADGSYANGCRSYTLSDWQNRAVTKGATSISTGVDLGKAAMGRALGVLLPVTSQLSEQCKGMPNNNLDEGLAKVRFVCEGVKRAFGKS